MAAATDDRSLGLGRNIFCTGNRFTGVSPIQQLIIPCELTKELSQEIPSPTEEKDGIIMEAHSLARNYILYKLDGRSVKANTEAERTLRRVGDEMIDRHQTVVNAVAKRLRYSDVEVDEKYEGYSLDERMFLMIADEISKDSQENWGRVVSLFVLGAILARNNEDEHHGKHIESIIQSVGNYVGSRKRKWIEKNGGWDNFVRFFDNGASDESKVWKGLMFAGIGLASIAKAVTR